MNSTVVRTDLVCATSTCLQVSCSVVPLNHDSKTAQYPNRSEVATEEKASEALHQGLRAFLDKTGQDILAREDEFLLREDRRIEILVTLSRLYFVLGTLGKKKGGEEQFQRGRYHAELLCQEQPDRL